MGIVNCVIKNKTNFLVQMFNPKGNATALRKGISQTHCTIFSFSCFVFCRSQTSYLRSGSVITMESGVWDLIASCRARNSYTLPFQQVTVHLTSVGLESDISPVIQVGYSPTPLILVNFLGSWRLSEIL